MLLRDCLVALVLVAGVTTGCGAGDDAGAFALKRRPSNASSDGTDSPATKIPEGAGIPCDVATILETKCLACHGDTPSSGARSSLVTIADVLAPAKSDSSKNEAKVSLARMKDETSPMPPASYSNPVTSADISAFEVWIEGNYQGSCGDTTPTTGKPPSGLTCTSCHGDATRAEVTGADPQLAAAPPRNTKGETGSIAKGVGAHQVHLTRGEISTLVACNECHVVPSSTSHSNGVVGLTFGALAKTGNKTPAYDGTSCSSTYCHGNFTGGNTAAPSWTDERMTCTSCHDGPPSTGDHRRGAHRFACSQCHGNGFTATTVNKALHVNGTKDVGGAGSKIEAYDAATRSCTPTCHGSETW